MKRKLMAGAAAIALIAGMNVASAQMSGGQTGGGGDQPRAQTAPSGGGGNAAPRGGEERLNPGVHQKEPGAAVRNEPKENTKVGQSDRQDKPNTAQGPSTKQEKMGEGQVQGQGSQKNERATQREETQKSQVQGKDQKQGTQQNAQGKASAKSVQLSSEQRSKVRTTLTRNSRAERLNNVNFSISIGTRIPRTVRYYPLPIEVVEIVPEYRGYYYVLVDDEILIIDPDTFEIVAVLPA